MLSIELKPTYHVHYIMSGAGTEKSFIVRELDEHDLVITPFTKLKLNYNFFFQSGR